MIYTKTEKANSFLATASTDNNAQGTMQKICTLLTLIDGKTTVQEIQMLFGNQDIGMLLKSLVPLGLIIDNSSTNSSSTGSKTLVRNSSSADLANNLNPNLNDANKFDPVNSFSVNSSSNRVSDGTNFKKEFATHLTALHDLLLNLNEAGLNTFDLMYSLEKCNSANEVNNLIQQLKKVTSKSTGAQTQLIKILAASNNFNTEA